MNKREIALQIVLALIEKGTYPERQDSKVETLAKTFADLYNEIYKSLED